MDYPFAMSRKRQISLELIHNPRFLFVHLAKYLGIFVAVVDLPILKIYWKRLLFTYLRLVNIFLFSVILYNLAQNYIDVSLNNMLIVLMNLILISKWRAISYRNLSLSAMVLLLSLNVLLRI